MDKPDKDQDQESARFDELADKVDELSREKDSLEQRIRDLEMRVTGAHGKDEMTYNFIVEKQTTQMQWTRDRDSPASPKSDRRDRSHNRNALTYPSDDSRTPSIISGTSATQQPPKGAVLRIEQLANNEQHPRAVFGENGELFIVYTPNSSATKVADTDGGSDDGIHKRSLRRREVQPETESSKTTPENLGADGGSDDGIHTRGLRRREVEPEGEAPKTAPTHSGSREDDSTKARVFRPNSDDEPTTGKSNLQNDGAFKDANRDGPGGNDVDIQARAYRPHRDDETPIEKSTSQDLNKPSSKDGRGAQTRGVHSDGQPSRKSSLDGNNSNKPTNREYTNISPNEANQYDKTRAAQQQAMAREYADNSPNEANQFDKSRAAQQQALAREYADYSPNEANQIDKSRAAQQQALARGREPMLPQVIVVTGLRNTDLKRDVQECPDEDESGCNCYQIMKESEEWKANVTKLLELLVMNAYGSRCPRSLIKALMDPSTREQAIAELLDRTFPASDNTVSQDNISKMNYKDYRHNKDTSASSLINKNKAEARSAADNKKDTPGMTRTFAQFPPYPPASFESKESLPRHAQNRQGASSNRTPTHTTQQGGTGHSNKIDIVCPPGSRPIIHIPPSGVTAVTCNAPPRAQDNTCCNPKNPCPNHK